MPGTREGGLKGAAKILERDPDHYKRIGAMGGKNSNGGGFAYYKNTICDCDELPVLHRRPQCAAAKGGRNRLGYRKAANA